MTCEWFVTNRGIHTWATSTLLIDAWRHHARDPYSQPESNCRKKGHGKRPAWTSQAGDVGRGNQDQYLDSQAFLSLDPTECLCPLLQWFSRRRRAHTRRLKPGVNLYTFVGQRKLSSVSKRSRRMFSGLEWLRLGLFSAPLPWYHWVWPIVFFIRSEERWKSCLLPNSKLWTM